MVQKPTQSTREERDGALAALMRAAQAGDARAYRTLLKEITPRLRGIVRNQRGFLDPADLEDLVQDTLLSLHSVRHTYDASRPFMPWLMAIAYNRIADAARRHARRAAHEAGGGDVTFWADQSNEASDEYGDPQELRRLVEALPPRQRTAIEMTKLQGASLKHAAAATGTTVGALKVSIHRAVRALRKQLKQE
jgi:RNA polymerase sigma-70 factor (ECF subfamily)